MATSIRPEETQPSLPMESAEAPIRAEGFNHLHINVRDLARSIRFYKEAFGLKVGFSAGKDLIFMVPEAGGHSLALHQVGPDGPVGMAGGFQHFGFKLDVNDHDRVIKQVKKAGGNLVSRRKARRAISIRLRSRSRRLRKRRDLAKPLRCRRSNLLNKGLAA